MANIRCKSYNFYFIYVITNLINNRCYVGFHATNNENDNYFGSSKTLDAAIKKYGKDNFIKEIIEYVNYNNWKEKETHWIKIKNAHVSLGGYNLTWGGDGTLGLKMSDETKEKISILQKNRSEETKQKISIALTGKHHSDETKKRYLRP